MKKLIFLWLFGYMAIQTTAQELTIYDSETSEPLGYVTLVSEDPNAIAITDENGATDISAFEGAAAIKFRLLGYNTKTLSFAELEAMDFLLKLSPADILMDEVIISATRWDQVSTDVPSKIDYVSQKEVAFQNPQTAADLLNVSGKVFIQKSQQGGGSPMIRGFATNRLLYAVDGVRMNTAIFRSGNLQNVISLDPFVIERTEVLFGPGSIIYGSDAIGAVMSFQTLTPRLSFSAQPLVTGHAAGRFSTANHEKTGHADVNIGWQKWATSTSFSFNDYSDLRMGSHGPEEYLRHIYVERKNNMDVVVENENPLIQKPSGYSQFNVMQKVRFRPNDQWDFHYDFHYSQTSDYGRYDRHLRLRNGIPRYGEWHYGPQKWMMNHFHFTHKGLNHFYDKMTLRSAHQYFQESRISRDLHTETRERRKEEVDAWSVNLDFVKGLGTNHKLFYGVEYVLNDVTSTGTNENILSGNIMPGPSRYPQATWASYGVYIADQYRITEEFLLQGSARYTQFGIDAEFDTTFYPFPFSSAKLNKGAFTGSIGIVHRPSPAWVISANAATAFRSPNVDDVGKVFDSEPGSVVVPNPNLEAEYAYNVDFELARSLGGHVKINFAGYYTKLNNAMVRRDYTLNGMDSIVYDGILSQVQAIQNAAVARVYGVQLGVEGNFPSGIGFSSDLNYQVGEEELDDGMESPSRHAPPWFGISRLMWSSEPFELQFYVLYSGSKKFEDMPEEEKGKPEIYAEDTNGNPWSPGWFTMNLKAMYNFDDKYAIQLGMENLTDKRYRPYSSGIAAPGRNLMISFRSRF